MNITIHPDFKKAYRKRIANNPKLVARVKERLEIFRQDPTSVIIKDHRLKGNKRDFRAFWITGDLRIIYFPASTNDAILLDIGSHN